MNKKGVLSGWVEISIFTLMFIIIAGTIVVSLNSYYNKNYTVGLETSGTQNALTNYIDQFKTKSESGEITWTSSEGLSWKSSWDLIILISKIIWDVIMGNWIPLIISLLHWPSIVGILLQILYFLSAGFGIISLLFRSRA